LKSGCFSLYSAPLVNPNRDDPAKRSLFRTPLNRTPYITLCCAHATSRLTLRGDLIGGSRGFTIFDSTYGSVLYTSGNTLDHIAAKYEHYPDERSGNKGNEAENVAYGIFQDHTSLFVNTERSSIVCVYDVTDPANPVFIQVLPVGAGPEGGVVIPSRSLYVVLLLRLIAAATREMQICIRAVYYLLNSIARRTSLEIREFTLPGPGPF
jgi:hypothetical protein